MPSPHDSNLLSYGCQLSLRPDNIYGLMKNRYLCVADRRNFIAITRLSPPLYLENHTPYDYHTDSIAI